MCGHVVFKSNENWDGLCTFSFLAIE
jgi:hypothetical protein